MIPGLGVYDPGIGVYATWIRSLCSKIENNNHLSLAEAEVEAELGNSDNSFCMHNSK